MMKNAAGRIVPEEIKHYSPKKIDLIDLENHAFASLEISPLVKKYGPDIPRLTDLVSAYRENYVEKLNAFQIDYERDDLLVTFDGLISDTAFWFFSSAGRALPRQGRGRRFEPCKDHFT